VVKLGEQCVVRLQSLRDPTPNRRQGNYSAGGLRVGLEWGPVAASMQKSIIANVIDEGPSYAVLCTLGSNRCPSSS
jgi:hypothetical protein